MRLGIIGSASDPQSLAVKQAFERLGHATVLVESGALDQGFPIAFEGGKTWYGDDCVDDVLGWYVRSVPSAQVAAFTQNDQLTLYRDWFVRYMQSREKASFFISWLLQLDQRGVMLVNGPHSAGMLQSKPLQLHVLRSLGARVPRTLITNDPARVRAFHREVGEVIFKPVTGGAETHLLDAEALRTIDDLRLSPVIFQERVQGDDLRIVLMGDEVVSSVAIETPHQHLDFRADPTYRSGQVTYREVTLPVEIQELCRKAARQCGLTLAGIDIKAHDGNYTFLELNSSPVYLDVERKRGHPISEQIARCVAQGAEAAERRDARG